MHAPMRNKRPAQAEPRSVTPRSPGFERAPWRAQERVLEEPRSRTEEPLRLAMDEHVVDVPLDGDAILRVR
jgi:hypothetical protein